ncbi:HoxN/HupN/NixA family nickel/cobalt transporter [Anderseniella sp. Alg231-50]|uniref:HoxN/HupN/NixA family nickel/cobalt transporter n=1 Tax=Anderseniella sp. Alg231-50 TaxID=1922226 RepID=UPI000D54B5E1
MIRIVLVLLALAAACLPGWQMAHANPPVPVLMAQADTAQPQTVKPGQLLLQRRKNAGSADAVPTLTGSPVEWIKAQQRSFYGKMSAALTAMKRGSPWSAALTLMALSFAYGILHAAGPGHGKAVVSAWLLANERQLKRGVMISFMAAMFQAITAVVLVSALLLTVKAAASSAKSMAIALEATSYGLIALTGLWLVWQAIRPRLAPIAAVSTAPAHDHLHHQDHHHTHQHDHHHDHEHGPDCGCGHAHMPSAKDLDHPVDIWKAVTIAFAVGIRPCTGGILVLLFSSALGLYWAGVAATFVMALGTAITVSIIASLAVKSRDLALKYSGHNPLWLDRTAFGLKLMGGLFIACVGGLLFWATATNTAPLI